jgi:hypothetical protein
VSARSWRASLREALQHLRPLAGAASWVGGLASSSGGEGGIAQLLYVWLNQQLGRPRLAFADLLGW